MRVTTGPRRRLLCEEPRQIGVRNDRHPDGSEEYDHATNTRDVVRHADAGSCGVVGLRLRPDDDPNVRTTDAATLPGRIWQDPGDTALLDLMYGAGGKAHAPDPTGTFTFVSEDPLASSPKFDVVDGQGVEWKVKLGQESQPETAATRFLWAAGYFTDEDYYLAELTVKGLRPCGVARTWRPPAASSTAPAWNGSGPRARSSGNGTGSTIRSPGSGN